MKKINIIVLFMLMFIVSGCNAEYNLIISDEELSESAIISTDINNQVKFDDVMVSDILTNEILDIPIYFDDYNNEFPEDKNFTNYLETKIINGNIYGVELSNNFREETLYKSTLIKSCYSEFSLTKSDSIYSIKTDSQAICFEKFPLLKNLKINIHLDYSIISSNADIVEGNTHTWNINHNNYMNKPVSIIFKTKEDVLEEPITNNNDGDLPDETNDDNKNKKENWLQTSNGPVVLVIYILLAAIPIGVIIYIISKRNSKSNKL